MFLIIYFHFQFYFMETIALTNTTTMGGKHEIQCCIALHQWKVFLPSQGRTLTHASILVYIRLLDPMQQAQFMELRDMYSPSTYHLEIRASSHGNPLDECPSLGSQNHIQNFRVNLPLWKAITSHCQVHSVLS